MRKCRGIGQHAVMEVSQVVGVRTRARTLALAAASAATSGASSKRRKVVAAGAAASQGSGAMGISYLQLRSRSLFMTPRVSKSTANCPRRSSPELDRLSRCSSNASSEVVRSGDRQGFEDLEAEAGEFQGSSERRETTPSSELQAESGDLESTEGGKPKRTKRGAGIMPPEAEIEEFFAAAERKEQQNFVDKYNYDVVRDAPLDGRYEWVRLKQ